VVNTHDLAFGEKTLTKRYASWSRGEHRREWSVLRQIHRYAPGLAPEPIHAELERVPPIVVMTRVPGQQLGPVATRAHLEPLAAAIGTLWSVPHDDPAVIDPWRDDLAFARRLIDGARPGGGTAAAAYQQALSWWDGPDPDLLRTPPRATVLGHRDPKLANYLWDGRRIRIVDFEDARAADPAGEVAILMEHMSARGLDADALRAAFTVDETRLLAARRLWAMFWLSLLLPGGASERRNPPGAADAQAERLLTLLARRS
jgi:hypothetical protein